MIQYVAVIVTVVGLGVAFPSVNSIEFKAVRTAQAPAVTPVSDTIRLTGAAHVIDGDTLSLGDVRIRLHGIDAPEMAQTCSDIKGAEWSCGTWSKAVLERLAVGSVTCVQMDIDRYDRIVGKCYAKDVDLNAEMVTNGAAFAYEKYSKDYVAHQAKARSDAVGLWRAGVQLPSEYRAEKREVALANRPYSATHGPEGCSIKGNISKSGRLYHVPGSRWYEGTSINTSKGEQWFCSEAQARAAGWRAAQS